MHKPEQAYAMQVRLWRAQANKSKCTHRNALLDEPNLEAQELVHLPHPLAVASRKVVIDRDHLQQESFR